MSRSRVLKMKEPGFFGKKHAIDYECWVIDLQNMKLGDDGVEELLNALTSFTRVNMIYLVT